MNNLQNNQKSDATPLGHGTVLAHVVEGVKSGVPIYKTLLKLKYSRKTFYNKLDFKTKRYLNELQCLKKSRRGKNCGSTFRKSDSADFNVC